MNGQFHPTQPDTQLPYPTAASAAQPITIVDIQIPFGRMVAFMIKWAFASIPALIVVWMVFATIATIVLLLVTLVFGGLGALLQGTQHHL